MTPVPYQLADGTQINLRVPTLHPDDDAASLALQELNDCDDMLEAIIAKAAQEQDPIKALGMMGKVSEVRRWRLDKFRKFLRASLGKDFGTDDIDKKVIAQCTDADIAVILRVVREGPEYIERLRASLRFTAADVASLARQIFPTPETLTAFAESLRPTPGGTGEPSVTSSAG